MDQSRSLARRAILAIALMVGFYALALGISGLLIWIPYEEYALVGRVTARLLVFCLGAAGTILWSIVPRPDRFELPGPRLTRDNSPRVFALIDEVAQATSQPHPAEVYLLNDVNAWVTQRGGVMGIGSRRVMGIGLPLMGNLSRDELRAVVAHEFGHYVSGDVALGPWIYKTRAAIGRTLAGVHETMFARVFNWYAHMFLRTTMAVSRRQEFVADETAARVAGPQPAASALRKVAWLAPAYDAYVHQELLPVLRSGFLPPVGEGFRRFMATPRLAQESTALPLEQTTGDVGEFNTHPSLSERLAALDATAASGQFPLAADDAPFMNDVQEHALRLLEFATSADDVRQLKTIAWDDVGDAVYGRMWQWMAGAHADWFASLTVGDLPSGRWPYEQMGRALVEAGTIADADQRTGRSVQLMTAGLGAALMRSGWRLETSPGHPIEVVHGDARLNPGLIVHRLITEPKFIDEWKDTCIRLGIAGLALRPVTDPVSVSTT